MPRQNTAFGYRREGYSNQWRDFCSHMIVPFAVCFCVAISVWYGFCYGDQRLLLGPSSSRLFKINPLLVKQVEVRTDGGKGVILYGFSHKPDLSLQKDWRFSDYVIIRSNSRKEFSLWLNKGSRIRIGWEAQTSSLNKLEISVFKGDHKYKQLPPSNSSSREAEYVIEEDDSYRTGIANLGPISIIALFKLNVSSRVHDLSKARSMCLTKSGSCSLSLPFPNMQYVAVTTPNDGDLTDWSVEISFVTRFLAFILILGALMLIVFLLIKYLGSWNDPTDEEAVTSERASETEPLVPQKVMGLPYGTDQDKTYNTGSTSEDQYDADICVICYDMLRNCFFVPCGHCATCHDCAMRIMEEESSVCPICRRLIHKVKKISMASNLTSIVHVAEAATSTPQET